VNDEVTDDHGGTDLCLSELQRCLDKSLGPAFVFLSCERYGWRALPRTCPTDEFDRILKLIPEGAAKVCINTWYQLDTNAYPPCYVLQKISQMREGDHDLPYCLREFWDSDKNAGAQSIMSAALRAAAEKATLSDRRLERFILSVTDKEVMEGVVRNRRAASNAYVFSRRIVGMADFVRGFQSRMDLLFGKQEKEDPVRLRKLMNYKEYPELVYATVLREDQALLQKLRNTKIQVPGWF